MTLGSSMTRAFCWTVGGCDTLTGITLVAWPALVLSALGAPTPVEPVYLRFVGVFVGAVGLAYLYPFLLPDRFTRRARVRAVLEWTAGVRLGVALFVATAVVAQALGATWIVVSVFDGAVALAQAGLLARARLADAS